MVMCSRPSGKYLLLCLLSAVFLLFSLSTVQAASRLYFTGTVEINSISEKPEILLRWGSLEGDLPDEIEQFKLYRMETNDAFKELAVIPYAISPDIETFIIDDWNRRRFVEVLELLNDISGSQTPTGPEITDKNLASFLTPIIDSSSPSYNPLQAWLFSRLNHNIARGMGLGFTDTTATNLDITYTYMLTAVTASGESLPIGQTAAISPTTPTVLPPPTQFRQVLVGGCSRFQKGLDDLNIHFTWDLPSAPQDIGLNILTYGYELYWSEEEIDPTIDLNASIPSNLHKMNPKPVVVAGPPEDQGAESFLSRDDGSSHTTGPVWKRGQQYYYYIARRDISGNFSAIEPITDAPVAVVDAQPPVPPWRVHTEAAMSPLSAGNSSPQLHLVWDQINPVNYARYFGTDRAICSIEGTDVCMAPSDADCADSRKVRCIDTDAISYDIFRFDSEAEATGWGTDSDGDLWPDTIETELGSDPCLASDTPPGVVPPQKIITIDRDDSNYQRQLSPAQTQMIFRDPFFDSSQYDQVFYYKIIARDPSGNQSSASPPIQAVFHNRVQPAAGGSLFAKECDHFTAAIDPEDTTYKEADDLLTLVDTTGEAVRWELSAHCLALDHALVTVIDLASGTMINSKAHIKSDMIDPAYSCQGSLCADIQYIVTFYNSRNIQIIRPLPDRIFNNVGFFSMIDLCNAFSGTVTLDATCVWSGISTPNRVAKGDVKICAPLSDGQVARVYQKVNGKMSPVGNIAYNASGDSCFDFTEGGGIVTSDLCLGVRIFSSNHIGSTMYYLDCLEMQPTEGEALPPAPILEGIYSKETAQGEPYLELHWSGLLEGQTSFVISMADGENPHYQTVFPSARNTSAQFTAPLDIPVDELTHEWKIKIRLISTDMRRSPWSEEMAGVYQAEEPETVAWPAMRELVLLGDITAVLIKEGSSHRPALLLSNDLTQFMSLSTCGNTYCIDALQECDGSDICVDRLLDEETGEIYEEPSLFENLKMCTYLQPQVKVKNFIVYRQESGKDFIQVSPFISGFSCETDTECITPIYGGPCTQHDYSKIRDPFYSFRNLLPSAIIGEDQEGEPIDPATSSGPRMFYLDHYPAKAGMTVRYKVIIFNPKTGEPKKELTSNWLTLQ